MSIEKASTLKCLTKEQIKKIKGATFLNLQL